MAVQLRCLLLIGLLFADLTDDLLEVILPANTIVCTAPPDEQFIPLSLRDLERIRAQVEFSDQCPADLTNGNVVCDGDCRLALGAPPPPLTPELLALMLSLRC